MALRNASMKYIKDNTILLLKHFKTIILAVDIPNKKVLFIDGYSRMDSTLISGLLSNLGLSEIYSIAHKHNRRKHPSYGATNQRLILTDHRSKEIMEVGENISVKKPDILKGINTWADWSKYKFPAPTN